MIVLICSTCTLQKYNGMDIFAWMRCKLSWNHSTPGIWFIKWEKQLVWQNICICCIKMIVAFQSDSFNTDIMSTCHPHSTRVIWQKSIWRHRTKILGLLRFCCLPFWLQTRLSWTVLNQSFWRFQTTGCSSIWRFVGTGEIYLSPASYKWIKFRKIKFQCELWYINVQIWVLKAQD